MALDERKDTTGASADRKRSDLSPSRRDDWSSFWNDPFTSWLRQRGHEHPFGFFRRHPGGVSERDVNWTPDVETFQRGDRFVVRADLPGMKREEITLQVTDDTLTIEGERRSEFTENHDGYYRTERSYGTFSRVIPLPEGALSDTAKASFENGVLEVAIQAPPREVSRGRRVEIAEPSPEREPKKQIFPE
jgi:HSP20 family molecular chaperone IbpA